MTPKNNALEICLFVALFLMGIIVGACLYFGHPAEYPWLPACPLHVWTGWLCPGCGTLRATHYLLNGELYLAFRCQPLLFSLVPILLLLAGKSIYTHLRKTSLTMPLESQLYWLIVITIFLFFVLRNIPLDCLDCLRPPKV